MDDFDALLVDPKPRFVIFSSYGNDSVALIQWAHEQGLRDVYVVYSDTGWAAKMWADRVDKLEAWARSLGFHTRRTKSISFVELARLKQAFPTQRYQWCSYILKIAPGEKWLAENDPECRAVCLVGVRREESQDRASFPAYLLSSNSHGGRVMVAPMAEWSEETRDEMLRRAGVEPLPHRSMECSPCINSNKRDLQAMSEDDIQKAEDVENAMHEEFGLTSRGKRRTFFRPARHMGAVGVREVVRWAKSPRGKFVPAVPYEPDEFDTFLDEIEETDAATCEAGWCGT